MSPLLKNDTFEFSHGLLYGKEQNNNNIKKNLFCYTEKKKTSKRVWSDLRVSKYWQNLQNVPCTFHPTPKITSSGPRL